MRSKTKQNRSLRKKKLKFSKRNPKVSLNKKGRKKTKRRIIRGGATYSETEFENALNDISKDIIPRLKGFKYDNDNDKSTTDKINLYDVLLEYIQKLPNDKDYFEKIIKISSDITNTTPEGQERIYYLSVGLLDEDDWAKGIIEFNSSGSKLKNKPPNLQKSFDIKSNTWSIGTIKKNNIN